MVKRSRKIVWKVSQGDVSSEKDFAASEAFSVNIFQMSAAV